MMQIRNAADAEMGETILQRLTTQINQIDKELANKPTSILQAAKAECARMKSRIYESLCKFYGSAL